MYIVAQTAPLLRVLYLGSKGGSDRGGGPSASRAQGSVAQLDPSKGKTKAAITTLPEHEAMELVELPTGRIVPADSDEGNLRVTPAEADEAPERLARPSPDAPEDENAMAVDDEIHRIWADVGGHGTVQAGLVAISFTAAVGRGTSPTWSIRQLRHQLP